MTRKPNRNQRWQLSRRTVLRGLGASMAVPLLDAMAPVRAATMSATSAAPTRMAFLFVPNGVQPGNWRPEQEGFGYQLSPILEPLQRVRDQVSVLSGLTHDKGRANGDGPGDHARSASVFLTGAQPRKTSGEDIRVGISVDQVAAQAIGDRTRFASLELGTEQGRNAGGCDSGYSCAYSSNISWSGPASPVGKEINPRLVFERLFGNGNRGEVAESQHIRNQMRRSILDFVAEDANALQARLGRGDQRKLDEYLTGIRQIEQRLERVEQEAETDGSVLAYRGPENTPRDFGEHIRLMADMLVLAFQTDSTRVATFMFANAGSNRSYRNVNVPDGHHDLSHHGGDSSKLEKIKRINQFHITQLAYMLEKMAAIPEGDGCLLDNCMIMYGSGLNDGNRHNNEDLPILLAGGGGGSLRPGQHIRFPYETPLNNLFLSMLDRVGAPTEFMGDSTGRLSQLDV